MSGDGSAVVVIGGGFEVVGGSGLVDETGQHVLPVGGLVAEGAPGGRVVVAGDAVAAVLGVGEERRPGRCGGGGEADGGVASAIVAADAEAAVEGGGGALVGLGVTDVVLEIVVPGLADCAAPPSWADEVIGVVGVHGAGEPDLLQVGGAGDGARLLAGLAQGGQQHRRQNGDDGDDDE